MVAKVGVCIYGETTLLNCIPFIIRVYLRQSGLVVLDILHVGHFMSFCIVLEYLHLRPLKESKLFTDFFCNFFSLMLVFLVSMGFHLHIRMAKIVVDSSSLTQPLLLYLGLGSAMLEQHRRSFLALFCLCFPAFVGFISSLPQLASY
jgi:hypothetical protein